MVYVVFSFFSECNVTFCVSWAVAHVFSNTELNICLAINSQTPSEFHRCNKMGWSSSLTCIYDAATQNTIGFGRRKRLRIDPYRLTLPCCNMPPRSSATIITATARCRCPLADRNKCAQPTRPPAPASPTVLRPGARCWLAPIATSFVPAPPRWAAAPAAEAVSTEHASLSQLCQATHMARDDYCAITIAGWLRCSN